MASVKLSTIIGYALVALVIALVQVYWGWDVLLMPWRAVSPAAVSGALALIFISHLLRAGRLYDHLRDRLDGRYFRTLQLALVHNLANTLMPMRSGELALPVLLSRWFAVDSATSVSALLWLRLLDVCCLAGIICLALAAASGTGLWLVGVALTGLLPFLVSVLTRVAPPSRSEPQAVRAWLRRVAVGMPDSPTEIARGLLWTVLNWGVKLVVMGWVLKQFVAASASTAILAAVAAEVGAALPIAAPGGVGTFEAAVVAVLSLGGTEPMLGAAASINLHLFILGSALLFGLVALTLPGPASNSKPKVAAGSHADTGPGD